MQKNETGKLVPDLSLFFKKQVKASVCNLVSIYFHGPQIGIQ